MEHYILILPNKQYFFFSKNKRWPSRCGSIRDTPSMNQAQLDTSRWTTLVWTGDWSFWNRNELLAIRYRLGSSYCNAAVNLSCPNENHLDLNRSLLCFASNFPFFCYAFVSNEYLNVSCVLEEGCTSVTFDWNLEFSTFI